MADDEKKSKLNAAKDIPPEVLEQLPDSVKQELGIETDSKEKEEIFSSEEAKNITEGMNRMSTAFEKIGLTLIGRMGEFATTLERVMMIVARIEKVENLVAEMKYFMKGLQKTLDNLQRSVDNVTAMDFTSELKELKTLLSGAPIPTVTPSTTNPIEKVQEVPLEPVIHIETPQINLTPTNTSDKVTPLDDLIANSQGNGVHLAKKAIEVLEKYLEPGLKSNEIADELEKCKTFISEKYKWIPALYEIGKVARQYKTKKDTPITPKDIIALKQEMNVWSQKL
ncbi:MAG: hypothetical protein EAX96_01640 [Candidatus Lokiarchaeota archaeon]|nr:hypothetical protein [Candidatus Lokiarchaeota archaeon]